MKHATVTSKELKGYPSRTARLELRAGAKGKGKSLWSCQYWPDSGRSVEQAYDYLAQAAERLGVEYTLPEREPA